MIEVVSKEVVSDVLLIQSILAAGVQLTQVPQTHPLPLFVKMIHEQSQSTHPSQFAC